MYMPLVVAFGVIALFGFPALAFGASKIIKSRFNESRPEPSRPNNTDRTIPGGNSGNRD